MKGMMQPVGPESEQTYWVRRVVVIGIILVLVAVLGVVLVKMFGGSKQQADPVASSSVPVPSASSPGGLPSGVSSTPPSPSASASPSASRTPSSSAPATSSSSATPSSPTTAPSASTSAKASSVRPSASPSASPSKQPTPSAAAPVACRPADLHLGIDSAPSATSGKTLTLKGTLLASRDCTLQWANSGFELRIFSGADRIWSTNDCSGRRPSGSVALKRGRPVAFTYNWPTQRSVPGANCQMSDEYLRPGTYVATLVMKDVAPVQRVFRLVG